MSTEVGVLMGGRSAERDVSLVTGNSICSALLERDVDAVTVDTAGDWRSEMLRKKVDVAFIALHGRGGEDGTIQGALELMDIPYTGSGVLASALAMDKIQTKRILDACGIPTAPYVSMGPGDYDHEINMPFPVVVKPSREGSTIGISIVREKGTLKKAIRDAARHDPYVLIESFVPGEEYTVGILNGKPLAVVQIVTANGFYDYETKYVTGADEYRVPAPLDPEMTELVRSTGLETSHALRCSGAVRVDLRGQDGNFKVLEVNTIPGMTPTSLLPKSAQGMGIDFQSLVLEMLKTAGEGSK
ncbi:D-alanine--D-alanine ligase [bacterium BMS3Abin14]|nr:D-alanine--D-alanine ligase [bacterium BMS3Abin14]